MKITRQTQTELEVKDSMLLLAGIFGTAALVMLYVAFTSGNKRMLLGVALWLLFAFLSLQRSVFLFDSARGLVTWRVLRYCKTSTGELAFDAINGIIIESMPSRSGGSSFRLTLQTSQGPVPLAAAYGGGEKKYEALREQILRFVKDDISAAAMSGSAAAATDELESSVRLLLQQGRKIDAIQLLRNSEDIDLTQATERVREIQRATAVRTDSR